MTVRSVWIRRTQRMAKQVFVLYLPDTTEEALQDMGEILIGAFKDTNYEVILTTHKIEAIPKKELLELLS